MGDEVNVASEGQSVDDVFQSQPIDISINQSEELIEGNEARAVDEDSLDDKILQDPQKDDISDISISQQPSNLELTLNHRTLRAKMVQVYLLILPFIFQISV